MSYVDQHGRLIRESTKQTLKADAQTVLDRVRVSKADGTLVVDAKHVTLERVEQMATVEYEKKAPAVRGRQRRALAWTVLKVLLPARALDITTAVVDRYDRDRVNGIPDHENPVYQRPAKQINPMVLM